MDLGWFGTIVKYCQHKTWSSSGWLKPCLDPFQSWLRWSFLPYACHGSALGSKPCKCPVNNLNNMHLAGFCIQASENPWNTSESFGITASLLGFNTWQRSVEPVHCALCFLCSPKFFNTKLLELMSLNESQVFSCWLFPRLCQFQYVIAYLLTCVCVDQQCVCVCVLVQWKDISKQNKKKQCCHAPIRMFVCCFASSLLIIIFYHVYIFLSYVDMMLFLWRTWNTRCEQYVWKQNASMRNLICEDTTYVTYVHLFGMNAWRCISWTSAACYCPSCFDSRVFSLTMPLL